MSIRRKRGRFDDYHSRMLKRLLLSVTAAAFVVVPVIFASSDMLVLEDLDSSPASKKTISISRDHEKGEYPRRFIERMRRRREEEYFQDSRTEAEQVNAYFHLMSLIEEICQEGLQREDQLEYVTMWMSAIQTLAEEAREANALKASFEDDSKMVLKRTVAFGKQYKRQSSDSDSSESTYSAKVHDFNDDAHDAFVSKSKMMSGECYESEDEKDVFLEEEAAFKEVSERDGHSMYASTVRRDSKETDYGTFVEYTVERADGLSSSSSSSSYSSGDDEKVVVTREHATTKRRGRRGGRGPGGVSLTDALGVAADVMMTSTTMAAGAGSEDGKVSEELAIGAMTMLSGGESAIRSSNSNGVSEELMDRMQEQLLAKIMAQLQSQTAGTGLSSNGEQAPTELVVKELLGEDLYALPEMSRESLIDFLRSSALPKLLNNLIKEKTGVNVLKNLAMALKLLNEGLGSVEIILKMLIRVTRTVRYYVLFASQVVKDMSREENEPMVDLSVSMDILPAKPKKKSSITSGMTKMFQRGLRKSKGLGGDEDGDAQKDMSPFSLAMHAALSKARDYKAEFQKIPSILLLKVIHTVFAELEKRNGVIRVAIARKKHNTLVGLQDSINGAVERVYEAISMHDPSCSEQLHALPPIITDILISLISPIKMKPVVLEKHLEDVTSWVKQFMVILDAEGQLAMLQFLLYEPEMPTMPGLKRGMDLKKGFSWTLTKQQHK